MSILEHVRRLPMAPLFLFVLVNVVVLQPQPILGFVKPVAESKNRLVNFQGQMKEITIRRNRATTRPAGGDSSTDDLDDLDEYDFDAGFKARLSLKARMEAETSQKTFLPQDQTEEKEEDTSIQKSIRDLFVSLGVIFVIALVSQNASQSFFARTPDPQYEPPPTTTTIEKQSTGPTVVDFDELLK